MKRKRLSSADRRESILAAATIVFAERGFSGATTQQIAAAAGVSEGLLYKHFDSKTVLYKAVLRQLIERQNANFALFGFPEPSTAGLLAMIEKYIRACLDTEPDAAASVGQRVLFSSLASDGAYARLVYKRALRLGLRSLKRALDAAGEAGDLHGAGLDPANVHCFLEHLGSMIHAGRLSGKPVMPYAGDNDAVAREALWFCARGIGIADAAIECHLAGHQHDTPTVVTLAPKAARPAPRRAAAAKSR